MTGVGDNPVSPEAAAIRAQLEAAGRACAHGVPLELSLSTDPVDLIAGQVIARAAAEERRQIHEDQAVRIVNTLGKALTG